MDGDVARAGEAVEAAANLHALVAETLDYGVELDDHGCPDHCSRSVGKKVWLV